MGNFMKEIDGIIQRVSLEFSLSEEQKMIFREKLTEIMRSYYFPLTGGMTQSTMKYRGYKEFWNVINEEQKIIIKEKRQHKKKQKLQEKQVNKERRRLLFIKKAERLNLEDVLAEHLFEELESLYREFKGEKGGIKFGQMSIAERKQKEASLYEKYLTAQQLQEYYRMEEEERKFELEQAISMTIGRFQNWGIIMTEKQAELFLSFEEKRRDDRRDKVVSEFEELEAEMKFMEDNLTGDVLLKYITHYHSKLARHIENLKSHNEQYAKEILNIQSQIDFYIEYELPFLCELRKELEVKLTKEDKNLIADCRAIYNKTVKSSCKKSLQNHELQHKDFVPNWPIRIQVYEDYLLLKPDILYTKEFVLTRYEQFSEILKNNHATFIRYENYLFGMRQRAIEEFENSDNYYDPEVFMVGALAEELVYRKISLLFIYPNLQDNINYLKVVKQR